MDASNAKRNQKIGLDIGDKTLKNLGHQLKRYFIDIIDFKSYFSNCNDLIIEAIEPRIQRSSHKDKQKSFDSSKNHLTRLSR